jgi:hypothetical protein
MLRLDILQDQWLILALGGGLELVLAVIVAYLGYWRTPSDQAEAADRRPVPWVLILVYAATPVFAIVYLIFRAMNPPNW